MSRIFLPSLCIGTSSKLSFWSWNEISSFFCKSRHEFPGIYLLVRGQSWFLWGKALPNMQLTYCLHFLLQTAFRDTLSLCDGIEPRQLRRQGHVLLQHGTKWSDGSLWNWHWFLDLGCGSVSEYQRKHLRWLWQVWRWNPMSIGVKLQQLLKNPASNSILHSYHTIFILVE